MKVFNLFRNLWQMAKSYSDSNLQIAKTYRKPDYTSMIFPITSAQQSTWTYTAPSDGTLLLAFFSSSRTYIGIYINEVRVFDYATGAAGISGSPVTVPLSQGDKIRVADLNANTWLGTSTAFVPFVGGVILNHFFGRVVAA